MPRPTLRRRTHQVVGSSSDPANRARPIRAAAGPFDSTGQPSHRSRSEDSGQLPARRVHSHPRSRSGLRCSEYPSLHSCTWLLRPTRSEKTWVYRRLTGLAERRTWRLRLMLCASRRALDMIGMVRRRYYPNRERHARFRNKLRCAVPSGQFLPRCLSQAVLGQASA